VLPLTPAVIVAFANESYKIKFYHSFLLISSMKSIQEYQSWKKKPLCSK
jgi:hypothetical protein